MQAETVAWASIGCWSNAARSCPCGRSRWSRSAGNAPAAAVWTSASQRSAAKPDLQRLRLPPSAAAEDQGVRQPGVVVGDDLLEPRPIVRRRPLVEVDQPGR